MAKEIGSEKSKTEGPAAARGPSAPASGYAAFALRDSKRA
jgi:hypothetical protein